MGLLGGLAGEHGLLVLLVDVSGRVGVGMGHGWLLVILTDMGVVGYNLGMFRNLYI